MGIDKAEIVFGGRTLLENAVTAMRSVSDQVVIVGERKEVPADVMCLPDMFAGCGPMGGMETALRDCEQNGAKLAAFLPIDTPLLPGGLLRGLVEFWSERETVRVGVAVADGYVQPLISVLHVDLLPALRARLEAGDHKLQPALRSATSALAEKLDVVLNEVFVQTPIEFGDRVVLSPQGTPLHFLPTAEEWERRSMWFANLNTPAELQRLLKGEQKGWPEVKPQIGTEHPRKISERQNSR